MQRVLSRNGYSYVEGNPVSLTDPSGEFIEGLLPLVMACPLCAAAIVVGALAIALIWANVAFNPAVQNACQSAGHWMQERLQEATDNVDRWLNEALRNADQHRGHPLNYPSPDHQLEPPRLPPGNPWPQPTPTQQPRRMHITLGLSKLREKPFPDVIRSLDLTLVDFTDRLNMILKPTGAEAYMWVDWPIVGIATDWTPPTGFYQAIDKVRAGSVEMIHFNLTGVLNLPGISSYNQFADSGSIHQDERATAHELYIIRQNSDLCARTLFYDESPVGEAGIAGFPMPSQSAKVEICGHA